MSTNRNIHQPNDAAVNEEARLVTVDPAELLVDYNVRHDPRLDKEFVASIRDLGVLVPVVAVRTSRGKLRVRYGHRRTLAAVEAGLAYIPVVVVGDEQDGDSAAVARLISQYAENEHRAALNTSERVAVFHQLQAFGMTAAQVAKATKTKRKEVDGALAVAASDVAQAVTDRYDFLTLTQAATIAEFSDDREAVKALVKAARDGQFDHLAQRLRDDRAEAAAIAAVAAELEASGVKVVTFRDLTPAYEIADELLDPDHKRITLAKHASCPGHAAYIVEEWVDRDEPAFVPVYVCLDAEGNGHAPRRPVFKPKAPTEPTEEQRAERRAILANNKAWRSAETVRREWVTGFLARKTVPKFADRFVAQALVAGDYDLRKAMERGFPLAAELFGTDASTLAGTAADGSEGRVRAVAVGLVIAGSEEGTGVHSWRNPTEATGRYLRFLALCGYELSTVEELAAGIDAGQGGAQ